MKYATEVRLNDFDVYAYLEAIGDAVHKGRILSCGHVARPRVHVCAEIFAGVLPEPAVRTAKSSGGVKIW